MKGKGTGRKAHFALGSLLLHALLLTFAATRREPAVPLPTSALAVELELDVTSLVDDEEAPAPTRADAAPLGIPSTPTTLPRGSASAAAEDLSDGEAEAETEADGSGEQTADAAAPAASSAAPRLGLAQLGLTGSNQFLDRSPSAPTTQRTKKRRDVKKRLDLALAQGLQDRDTALGFGAGSPVMRSLESAVYASSAPLNGNALFTFVIDSDGKLVSSSVGTVSSDRDKWERVARQAAQALAQRQLVVPKGRSVRLTVAVTSHLELPSGRDPGLDVRALGIPLKKGGGDRSTRVDILNPLNLTAPLMLSGDPADMRAKARRMVRSHVVSEEVL
jgi:hypothetical protein